MRNLQRVCGAIVLTCLLALPTFAGHMATPAPQPDPAPTPTAEMTGTDAAVVTGTAETNGITSDSLTEAVLDLISSVLALL